ncbi:divergent PAP2 family protein [Fusibacter tunisiensis]|uniref:Acid phosphatase family membrane protein YuiD n=1 Tax=Fusibacter tunisiensis TaxID=1008308 RepID=A0ABS2MQ77_9FIRM|nr:divergent PAP2 family protein [Fusibacter tunisiensis]MBM7561563.1 acid phosphatase family membrane protein YuiD [Fusibacter tunisiensis]
MRINALLDNKVLIAAFIAWFIAQFLKVLITFVIEKEFRFERLHGSGGMPSSHTSTIVAASTAIGLLEGWETPFYGLSLIMAFIVMYDASGVRRSVGKQAKIINDIIKDIYKHKHLEEEHLKELVGHKPTEVAVGAILGIIIANLVV